MLRSWRWVLVLIVHFSFCNATRDPYTVHDGPSVASSIYKRHRDPEQDRKHSDVHSSAAAVAKVRAQHR